MPMVSQISSSPALLRKHGADDFRRQIPHYVMGGILLLLLILLMVYPLVSEVGEAFAGVTYKPAGATQSATTHLFWFDSLLRDKTFKSQLENSLLIGLLVTLLCNAVALPLALIANYFTFRGKAILTAVVLVPLVLPPFVGAIGMKQLLGTFGTLTILLQHVHVLRPDQGINWLREGGLWALIALVTLGLYPIAFLNIQAALANIDPAMLEAAQNLGGRRLRNFFRITLPLAMPGIFAGSTIIFIWAFTELGTPLLLDYRQVVSRSIWDDLASTRGGTSSMAYAKVVVVLLIAVLVYLVGKSTLGRRSYAMTSKAAVNAVPRKLGGWEAMLAALPFVVVTFFAVLPHLAVVAYSFTPLAFEPSTLGSGPAGQIGWYRTIVPSRYTLAGYHAVFTNPDIYRSIFNSIKYASAATMVDIVLGISIAWVLVRTRIVGRFALDSLAMLPLAVPGLVMAYGYVAVQNHPPVFFGHPLWDANPIVNVLRSPFLVLVIAYSVRRLPYLVRSAAGGLQQTSVTLEEAAANLGAPPWRVLLKITLPLILANLIAGSLLTFSAAMLEVSDSLILTTQSETFPIAKTIYSLGIDSAAAESIRNACCLGVIAMVLLAATLLVAAMIMGKRLGALFRA
jgi:iron(III) transport system permease protein